MTLHRATSLSSLKILAAFLFSPVTFAPAAVAQDATAPSTTAPDEAGEPPIQSIAAPAVETIPKVDPIALYGDGMIFDVYRKGSKIGTHQATFTRNGNELTVTSQMELAVDVLFFTAYKFTYASTEIWRDDKLVAVSATADDNGKISKTNARVEDGLLKVDSSGGTYLASSWVFPTNHWHRGQANSGTILNTLNGKLNKVEVVRKGIERVATAQGSVDADRLGYTGDLRDTDVWYDAMNRWVQMTFKAKDGSVIEYRCKQCGLAPGVPATVAAETAPATSEPAAIQQEAAQPVQ
jgi:hypothetical protein